MSNGETEGGKEGGKAGAGENRAEQEFARYKQRLQQLFFPEGIAYDGNRFNRTAATAPLFNYLAPSESADEKVVSRVGIEPTTTGLQNQCSTVELR